MSKVLGRLDASNWKDYQECLHNLRTQLSHGGPFGVLLSEARNIVVNGLSFASERLEDISTGYKLMCEYLLKGYKDDHRAGLYRKLSCRFDRLLGDMMMYVKTHYDNSVSTYLSVANQQELNIDDLRSRMEAFVSDSAMLSLEPHDKQLVDGKAIYEKRHKTLLSAFNRIVASPQWTQEIRTDMQNLINSPTIDSVDALTLTSAIMLSTLLVPDVEKLIALVEIYSGAADERLRQRALVGWAFSIENTDLALYPNAKHHIEELLVDNKVCEELLQLQMQVLYCMNAERDNETIQNDVMPTIINNQSIEITRYGIREKADDPMEDILHPDEADKKMEDMEKSIRKMVDMQKQGADIYFGGFSKMKRFGFFYTLSNWFTPFYKQHPQLDQLSPDMLNAGFLDAIFKSSPFCDSDKYSFVLGLSTIYNKLPQNIREMLSNGGASMEVLGTSPDTDVYSEVYIRRQYLQDLYRFFRINDCRQAFRDPFNENGIHLFMDIDIFHPFLHIEAKRMERFLLKHKRIRDVRAMSEAYYSEKDADDILIKARLAMCDSLYEEAESLYTKALKIQPDNVSSERGVALASFYAGHYGVAAKWYNVLSEKYPDKSLYKLNLAISLINDNKAEEGVKYLYELYYNRPDDVDVKRALAWGHLCLKHLDQADKLYDDILSNGNSIAAADYLNAGYCRWFENKLDEAVDMFRKYTKKAEEQSHGKRIDFMRKLHEDASLLDAYGIADIDRTIVGGML